MKGLVKTLADFPEGLEQVQSLLRDCSELFEHFNGDLTLDFIYEQLQALDPDLVDEDEVAA